MDAVRFCSGRVLWGGGGPGTHLLPPSACRNGGGPVHGPVRPSPRADPAGSHRAFVLATVYAPRACGAAVAMGGPGAEVPNYPNRPVRPSRRDVFSDRQWSSLAPSGSVWLRLAPPASLSHPCHPIPPPPRLRLASAHQLRSLRSPDNGRSPNAGKRPNRTAPRDRRDAGVGSSTSRGRPQTSTRSTDASSGPTNCLLEIIPQIETRMNTITILLCQPL